MPWGQAHARRHAGVETEVEIARILADEGDIQGYKVVEETPEGAGTPRNFVRVSRSTARR